MSSFGARISAIVVGLALVVAGATAAAAGPSAPGAAPGTQPPLSKESAALAAAALEAAPAGVAVVPQAVTAAVAAAGTLCPGQGFGVTSVNRITTGTYEVFFNQVITSGVYTASIGLCGNIGASAPGEITVIGRGLTTNGLFIQTYTSAGVLADRGFHVSVQF